MSYLLEVKQKEEEVVATIEEEEIESYLSRVTKPSGAEDALKFQYQELDTLTIQRLEKYLGALSQYLVYITKYINNLSSRRKVANSVYNRKLSHAIFKYSVNAKSMTEKEMIAQQNDPGLYELLDHIESLDAKLALYNNIPDTLENIIQTIKKVYDARTKERKLPE